VGTADENADLVRRAYDAWNRNDWDELAEIYHEDIYVTAPAGFMEPGEHRGWPELQRRYREVKAAWQDERIEIQEMATEDEMVSARVKWIGLGRSSQAPISLDVTNLILVEAGRITQLEYFWNYEDAVAEMRERARPGQKTTAKRPDGG
jgi:ketosteroid isomerase-like protein